MTKVRLLLVFAALVALGCFMGEARAQDSTAFTEVLVRSTFKIEGSGTSGTVFIMGENVPGEAGDARYVMLTAGHVLEGIRDDWATLLLRTKNGGVYQKLPLKMRVRLGGRPLWVKHPALDLAAMYVSLPRGADILLASTNLLASDSSLRNFEIGLGYEVFALGFPYNLESNDAGFPVLRSGHVASFPLYPTSEYKTFFVDLPAFPGNSGGPVFIMSRNPSYGGGVHVGTDLQFVLGILTRMVRGGESDSSGVKAGTYESLQLSVVVQAMHMKELLGMLRNSGVQGRN